MGIHVLRWEHGTLSARRIRDGEQVGKSWQSRGDARSMPTRINCSWRKPGHNVLIPCSPSLLRPMNPPSLAIVCMASRNESGFDGSPGMARGPFWGFWRSCKSQRARCSSGVNATAQDWSGSRRA